MTRQDPSLDSLYRAMLDGTLLAWSIKHAGDGDPVPRIWMRCVDDTLMRDLLWQLGLIDVKRASDFQCASGCTRTICLKCAAVIHGLVPTLRLDDIVAALRAKR